MNKISKKLQIAKAKINTDEVYSLKKALELIKKISYTKFDSSIELTFSLNLDVKQTEHQLRGTILLPNGNGKIIKILAATDKIDEAKKAGANIVASGKELNEILKKEKFNFDIIVTEPKNMIILGKFGKKLGPKGLMPNPKTETITQNIVKTIKEIKKGKANYRTDKNGIIHTSIGKVSMELNALIQNGEIIINTIKKLKPSTVKGIYIKNLTASSTMGPSIKIKI